VKMQAGCEKPVTDGAEGHAEALAEAKNSGLRIWAIGGQIFRMGSDVCLIQVR
jgi:hypothetical protein